MSSLHATAREVHASRLVWDLAPAVVLVIKKPREPAVTRHFKQVLSWLTKAHPELTVYIEPSASLEPAVRLDAAFLPVLNRLRSWRDDDEFAAIAVDLVLTLGGDGTVLYTSHRMQTMAPPTLSFALGSLGFLTPFDIADHAAEIDRALRGEVNLTLRTRLAVSLFSRDGTLRRGPPKKGRTSTGDFPPDTDGVYHVLNEIVIDRGPSPYISNLDVSCGGGGNFTACD